MKTLKTYWTRIYIDPEAETTFVDMWKTGEKGDGSKHILCFALRAKSKNEISNLLTKLLPPKAYEIDFCEERKWKIYGDFVGDRIRMDKKYYKDTIDSVEKVLERMKAG